MTAIQSTHPAALAPSTADSHQYHYAPGLVHSIIGLLLFGIGGFSMARASAANTRGLVIDGFIHLSPDNASTFYLLTATAAFAFVGFILFYVMPQAFIQRTIVLNDESITLPGAGFDKSHYNIPPSEIISANVTIVRNHRFLKIHTTNRTYSINPTWFSDPRAMKEILSWLHAHAPGRVL